MVVFNLAVWLFAGLVLTALVGGPQRLVGGYFEPVGRELGGWPGLILAAAGWRDEQTLPLYELEIEPRVFHAAALLTEDESARTRDSSSWWFPARFVAQGQDYSIDLQLLGTPGAATPAEGQIWRIRFEGEDGYLGIHELYLSPADHREHSLEIAMRNAARTRGTLAPPAGFANLRINGAEMGQVFWGEGNTQQMLERLGYPVGQILSLSESSVRYPAELAGSATSMASRPRYVPAIESDLSETSIALEKLERLTNLALHADDAVFESQVVGVLDVDKFLQWNALRWIYAPPESQTHRSEPSSPTWYFDPVTGLLEPMVQTFIPALGEPGTVTGPDPQQLTARLLSIPAFRDQRNEKLWQQTGSHGSDLVEHADESLGSVLTQLARSRGMLARVDTLRGLAAWRRAHRLELRGRVDELRRALATSQVIAKHVEPVTDHGASIAIELDPTGLVSIELTELRLELDTLIEPSNAPARVSLYRPDGSMHSRESIEPLILGSSISLTPNRLAVNAVDDDWLVRLAALEPESITPSSSRHSRKWRLVVELPFIDAARWNEAKHLSSIDVEYRNSVTGKPLPPSHIGAFGAGSAGTTLGYADSLRSVDEVIRSSGLPFEVRGDELVLPAGDYVLSHSLVLPRDHRLRLEPGVSLHLEADVSLVSFRAITALGTAEQPIRITAVDLANPFGVVGVVRASETSRFSHVLVSGGSRAEFDGIRFGGQLSFNDSPVVLSDCEISFAHETDGLNLKRSHFEIVRTAFNENGLDGLDANWSTGSVSGSVFANNGDDGIDLRNSRVDVSQSSFQWMRDKSISAGSKSEVHVVGSRFAHSDIAITSKDESVVEVRDSEFRRNRVGFSLYREKPVFGGAVGSVTGGLFAENERNVSVEPGSHLELKDVKLDSSSPGLASAVALEADSAAVEAHP